MSTNGWYYIEKTLDYYGTTIIYDENSPTNYITSEGLVVEQYIVKANGKNKIYYIYNSEKYPNNKIGFEPEIFSVESESEKLGNVPENFIETIPIEPKDNPFNLRNEDFLKMNNTDFGSSKIYTSELIEKDKIFNGDCFCCKFCLFFSAFKAYYILGEGINYIVGGIIGLILIEGVFKLILSFIYNKGRKSFIDEKNIIE